MPTDRNKVEVEDLEDVWYFIFDWRILIHLIVLVQVVSDWLARPGLPGYPTIVSNFTGQRLRTVGDKLKDKAPAAPAVPAVPAPPVGSPSESFINQWEPVVIRLGRRDSSRTDWHS